jgi:hypothetical protein
MLLVCIWKGHANLQQVCQTEGIQSALLVAGRWSLACELVRPVTRTVLHRHSASESRAAKAFHLFLIRYSNLH